MPVNKKNCSGCRRPKWTDPDLVRWQKEFGAGDNAVRPRVEPEWAGQICWSNELVCTKRALAS